MTDITLDMTSTQRRELLARLLAARAGEAAEFCRLSHGQRALWFIYQLDPASPAYNILSAVHVRTDVDRAALQRACQRLVDRHPMLRATFGMDQGVPGARIHAQHICPFELIDAAGWKNSELDRHIKQVADRPIDLGRDPVFRVYFFDRAAGPHVLLFVAAHIAIDFWSLDTMLHELQAMYREEATGVSADLPPLEIQFQRFVAWQDEMLAGPEGDRLWQYWRGALSGSLPSLDLPTDRPRPPIQTYRGDTHRFELPADLTLRLSALARSEGTTLYTLILAAYQVLLYRYSGQTEIIIGTATAGRNRAEWERIVGYFLNVVPVRGRCHPDQTFLEFLAQTRQTVLDGLNHQDFPFPTLVERLAPPRDVSRSPVFQVAFNWDKPRRPPVQTDSDAPIAWTTVLFDRGDLDMRPFLIAQQGSALDMTLVMLHLEDTIEGAIQYNSDLFDASTIERLTLHFRTLLEAIANNAQTPLAEIPLQSRAERQLVLTDWNDTAADYPRGKCLHDLFSAQAARAPNHVAVSFEDRELTYGEVDARSNQLARYLQRQGVGPETRVGICIRRSPEMVVGLLGILKAGGAYVPLAPGTPSQRLAYMLEESAAPIVLTQRDLCGHLPEYSGQLVCIDDDWTVIAQQSDARTDTATQPHQLAYVIFTSGSTGQPKGVPIEHRAVVNFLSLVQRRPGIRPDDKLLAVTTLTFDISVLELFLPLIVGAEVVIASRETAMDGQKLSRLINDSGASIMQATPATWRLLIQAGWMGNAQIKLLCGGEALPRDLANQLLDRCGSLWNMYGPTETTIWSSVDRVSRGEGPVPIGRPIANTQFYVLDDRLQPVPMGVPGELYIGGDGLARGYLNRPELTAERFVVAPFPPALGQRIYKTGDRVRHRPDGRIDFLGRVDFQVKVRGFRIELGEIETRLIEHTAIREAVVVARQASELEDDKQLVAYLISAGGELPSTSELRDFLKQKLPDYMIPSAFVTVPAFPLNAAGKIDRRALPAPEAARPDLRALYAPPRNALEATLADIFVRVLGLDQVGIHDDYFDLGGASMQSMEVAMHARAADIEMSPAMLFQFPTIASLAAHLVNRGVSAPPLVPEAGEESDDLHPAMPDSANTEVHALLTKVNGHAVAGTNAITGNTVIESLGVYLPPREVTTDELLRGCRNRVWLPIERMAGIHSRRMAGDDEFSIDLAHKAVEECLAYSKYTVDDIDLLICTNITRLDGPRLISVEPNTSLQLKKRFGFENAIAFDLTNACGGMFTAIHVADACLKAGVIRRAMVVSGEFITEISRTAQLEICDFFDSRIACLTVGDAGAAVILESANNRNVGFHELELYTVSRYNQMCIGRLTEEPHGGAIMFVPDPIKHTSISGEHSVMHAMHMLPKAPWPIEKIQHLLIHQTSRRSLRDGMRAINKALRREFSTSENTIDNLSYRGNTASTSHFVAIWDHIQTGRIKSGDNVVFAVSGSGQTIGTGLYSLDDLPDRLRNYREHGIRPTKVAQTRRRLSPSRSLPRVAVTALGTSGGDSSAPSDTTRLTVLAAEQALGHWRRDRNELDTIVFAGMTRTGYITEPAHATFVAGELKINDCIQSGGDRKTLAFDIYNAGLGMLNACEMTTRLIQSGKSRAAMIVTSEVDLNSKHFPDRPLELAVAGSAMVLEASESRRGFGQFVTRYAMEYQSERTILGRYHQGRPLLDLSVNAQLVQHYLELARSTVDELLALEHLTMDQIKLVLPSQFSADFHAGLVTELGFSREKLVDLTSIGKDLFTNSLPFSLRYVEEQGLARPGDIGLIINVASGIQVGCATYYF